MESKVGLHTQSSMLQSWEARGTLQWMKGALSKLLKFICIFNRDIFKDITILRGDKREMQI